MDQACKEVFPSCTDREDILDILRICVQAKAELTSSLCASLQCTPGVSNPALGCKEFSSNPN